MAKVFRGQAQAQVQAQAELPTATSTDELATGLAYVRALGDDGQSSLGHSLNGASSLSVFRACDQNR